MTILCVSACKSISGGGETTDTGTYDDSGTEEDCGDLDEVCCAQNLCDNSDLVCVGVTEEEALCLLQCVPPFCTEQGLDEALCQDVSDGAGLGACFSDEDLGVDSALESDNVCALDTYNNFCCPRSMGSWWMTMATCGCRSTIGPGTTFLGGPCLRRMVRSSFQVPMTAPYGCGM